MKTELFKITCKPMTDEISAWCVEPLYYGSPVGIVFWFPKYSLAKAFVARYKRQHTFDFWKHLKLADNRYSFPRVQILLQSMNQNERYIFQYS